MNITDKICVSKPYFALQNIQIGEYTMAEVIVENCEHSETNVISTAEAGRHAAILGSCALAAINEEKEMCYYLAVKAEVACVVTNTKTKEILDNYKLVLKAKVLHFDLKGKKGVVSVEIGNNAGNVLFKLVVEYLILKKALFQKLNGKNFRPELLSNTINPYKKGIGLTNIAFTKNECTAEIGEILPEMCVGHFDQYPALPVAILSDGLIGLAGRHLQYLVKKENWKYSFVEGILIADSLAFSGEYVKLVSYFEGIDSKGYKFLTKAINRKGDIFTSIELYFEPENRTEEKITTVDESLLLTN